MIKPELFFCGEREPAHKPYHYKECGLDNIFLMNGFAIDVVDGEEYVSVENVDGLWKAISINLVTSRKTFSPQEIRFLRRQMKMSQAELAKYLRVEDQTVARWEKSVTKIPGPADISLRVLFLSSNVAQPEGNEILGTLRDMVSELIEQDEPVSDEIHFCRHHHVWAMQRQATVVAYA